MQLILTRYTPHLVSFDYATAWRLHVTAAPAPSSPTADPKVFLMRQHPVDPGTGDSLVEFESVCGPYDFAVYPADTPNSELPYPYFRTDQIDIVVPAVRLADEAWAAIVAEVDRLLRGLVLLAQMTPSDEVTVGPA